MTTVDTNSVRIEDGIITVRDTGECSHDGRPVYRWTVALDSGQEWTNRDLCGPRMGPEPSEVEMLSTLLGFLSAALESREYHERTGTKTENEDLFPSALIDWAAPHSDEISMLCVELDPNDDGG